MQTATQVSAQDAVEKSSPQQSFERSNWRMIHARAMSCAANLKDSYRDMLEVLIEVEAKQIYFQLEITSLYGYCVEMLVLPEHTAYDFIDVIRTSKEIPELAKAVLEGKTTVSKARRVCSVITPKNQKEWIELASECSLKIIKKAVAMANPRAAVPETMTYISGDTLDVRFAVSEEWAELLGTIKDIASQKLGRAVTTEEALFLAMAEYKEKHDPLAKAKRSKLLREKNSRKIDSHEVDVQDKRYRPRAVEHDANLRDQNQCTHRHRNGERCTANRWLQKHHIVEFANGGTHALENLETLCWAHHKMRHAH